MNIAGHSLRCSGKVFGSERQGSRLTIGLVSSRHRVILKSRKLEAYLHDNNDYWYHSNYIKYYGTFTSQIRCAHAVSIVSSRFLTLQTSIYLESKVLAKVLPLQCTAPLLLSALARWLSWYQKNKLFHAFPDHLMSCKVVKGNASRGAVGFSIVFQVWCLSKANSHSFPWTRGVPRVW